MKMEFFKVVEDLRDSEVRWLTVRHHDHGTYQMPPVTAIRLIHFYYGSHVYHVSRFWTTERRNTDEDTMDVTLLRFI